MADEIEIVNVGGDGNIASEQTLLALVAAVEKLAAGKGSGAGAKVQQLYNQSVAQGTAQQTKNTKSQKSNTDALDENTNKLNVMRLAMGGLVTGLGQLAGSALNLGKELLVGGDTLSDFAKHVPLVGGYLSALTGLIDQNIDSFRTLSQVGATFGDGMNEIRAVSAAAGIPLGEFTELVAQNSQVMRMFGAGVTDGARNFANLSRELRTGPGRAFINMGYTATELNEALIDYAEFSQTQIGVDRRNNRMTAQSAAAYLETIDELAAVTGKRRDQIREEMNAAQADQRARLAMANMTAEQQARFAANLAEAPTALQDALTDAADGVYDNDLTQGLAVASQTFREQAGNIQNMNAQEYNNFLATVGRELDSAGVALGRGAQSIIKSGTGYGQAIAMASDLRNRQNMSDEEYARILEDRAKQAARDDALLQLSNTLREFRTAIMDAFISSGTLPLIQDAFRDVAQLLENFVKSPEFREGLTEMANKIKGFIQGLKDFDLGEMWQGVKDALVGGLASVLTSPTVIAAIAGLFAAKALINGVSSAASRGIENRLSSIFGGGNNPVAQATRSAPGAGGAGGGMARSVGQGAAQLGTGLGKGLGNLAGGVLRGVAAGLQAFANPAVAIGAAVFAGAILLIGGAIAGASWLLGKSLPTLVEGFKSFEELDGGRLREVGVGLLALSGGLAAFGVGSAVAGLGNLVGGIAEGITSLFGGQTPLEKLQEFASYNINADRVKSNAEALVAYSTAMAAYGGGQAAGGLGALVGGIAGGIAAFFGGDTELPYEEIQRFARYNLPVDRVEQNARALVAYSNAMAAYAAGAAGSSILGAVGAVADAITGFFGGETELPYDKINEFANAPIGNADRIRANADAVAAFGNAMSSLPDNLGGKRTGGVMGAIADFFSGEVVMPYDAIREFGEVDFGDVEKIKTNAEAVSAFGNAMSDMPEEMPGASVFASFASGVAEFFGADTPYDKIREFGEYNFNVDAIRTNAEAISGMSTALSNMQSGVDFDPAPMLEYAEAIEVLVEKLGDLNEVLADNNDSWTQQNASAGELLSGINMSSSAGSQGINQLNTVMQGMLVALNEIKEINNKVERNTSAITSGNLASGSVSSTG